jgi:hypothetical protein
MNLRTTVLVFATSVLALGPTFGQETKPAAASDEPATPAAIKQFNDEKLADLSKQIAGKESQPAEAVFKNIKILTGIPATNVLKIMEIGFSRSLGTSCAHCHVAGQWDKDDKTPKQTTRDMWKMDHFIVSDLLKNIDGLKDRKPVINCTTCHRGQLKPALNLDADAATK